MRKHTDRYGCDDRVGWLIISPGRSSTLNTGIGRHVIQPRVGTCEPFGKAVLPIEKSGYWTDGSICDIHSQEGAVAADGRGPLLSRGS
jgi:hypothetical protein